jgi:hypothetical protein
MNKLTGISFCGENFFKYNNPKAIFTTTQSYRGSSLAADSFCIFVFYNVYMFFYNERTIEWNF